MKICTLPLCILGIICATYSFPLETQNVEDPDFDETFIAQFSRDLLSQDLLTQDCSPLIEVPDLESPGFERFAGLAYGNLPSLIDEGRTLNQQALSAWRNSTVKVAVHSGGNASQSVENTTATVVAHASSVVVAANNATLLLAANSNASVNAANSNGVFLAVVQTNSSLKAAATNSRAAISVEQSNATIAVSNSSVFIGSSQSRVLIVAVYSELCIMNDSAVRVIGKNNNVTYIDNLDGLAWDYVKVQTLQGSHSRRRRDLSWFDLFSGGARGRRELRSGNEEQPEPNQDGIFWDSGNEQNEGPKASDADKNEPEPNLDGLAWEEEQSN